MKKIDVIVKEKTILELKEDACKGDIIDLEELVQVDTSFIDSLIEEGLNKAYANKIEDAKRALNAEHKVKINELEAQISALTKENDIKLELKEQETEKKYILEVNELKSEIEILKQNRISELQALQAKNELDLKNSLQRELDKYNELRSSYELLEQKIEMLVNKKELEVENKYLLRIKELENEKALLKANQSQEFEILKAKFELEKNQAVSIAKEQYNATLKEKEETINNLTRQRASMNVKQTGEDLETWCDNEMCSYMQNGLFNCTWTKDNKVVKDENESKGSKADYIFKVYADEKHEEHDLLATVCLEMKDENPESINKKTNEFYYKKLDENRKKKGCRYALLVSNLEMDKPNILPIFKVREFEDMYVVRPGYMMTFLNMIASLTTRFQELILSKEKEMIVLKNRVDLLEEFESIKKSYLDKPLESLENQINAIIKSSDNIKKAARDIDDACDKINRNYLNAIEDKLAKFELKLDRTILKKVEQL